MQFIFVTDNLGNTVAVNKDKIVRLMETKDNRVLICFDNGVSPTLYIRESLLEFVARLNSN